MAETSLTGKKSLTLVDGCGNMEEPGCSGASRNDRPQTDVSEALEEALSFYGAPQVFNTDQGSQFTSDDFRNILKEHDIKISMAKGAEGCLQDIAVLA